NLQFGQSGSSASHLSIEGLTFTGGGTGLNIGKCSELWIDRCTIQSMQERGITAESSDTDRIHITRCEISGCAVGPGISMGRSNGLVINSQSVIALNHVHDIAGSSTGGGIWIRQLSWGNLVSGNLVHDTELPNIFLAGAGANPVNVVENNICYRCTGDYGLRVTADCVVRNNLAFSDFAGPFLSSPYQSATPTRITVVQNTFIGTEGAARMVSWSGGNGLVFANNACYAQTGNAINITGGNGSTVFAGLVTYGGVTAGIPSTVSSGGLADFVNVTWNGTSRDATPSASSPLRSAANAAYLTEYDLSYFLRTLPASTGGSR
ncbi:MAG: hypothetical protein EOP87_26995, partial [Verrucomicrobiaceae bacterium]